MGAALVAALVVGLALPAGLEAARIQFAFSEGTTTVVCILVSLAAAAIAFFLYRRIQDFLPRGFGIGLGIFRYLVLLAIAVLLLEPRFETRQKQSAPPVIAVLHDDTESMVIHRDSAYVQNEYPAQLKSFLDRLDGGDATTNFFAFGQDLDPDVAADSMSFRRSGTNISEALDGSARVFANQNLGAVVLITDGITTAGVNPLYSLDQFQLPVFTVLVGDTTEQKDVRVADVLFNEIAYLENETPVKVKVKSRGYDAEQLRVTISGEGKVLGSQTVAITAAEPDVDVDFLVKPERTGIVQYTISVAPLPEEISTRNNTKNIFINVLETKVKIALFGGFPHPDVGALRNAMDRDDRYEMTEFLHETGATFYNDPSAANLKDFDLFILHNFPFNQSDVPLLDRIKAEVEERKVPLMTFVGKYTQINLLQRSLGDYLGIVPGTVVNNAEEAQINFKPDYKNHSTFTFDESWIQLMNSAPPLYRNQSSWKGSGDTKILATARIKGIALDYPVYGLQNKLGRKNMVFVGENFWRTRAHVYVEREDFSAFDQWIYNNIQWLIVKEDKRKFKVRPSKRLFTGQEPVLFRGEAYDDSYNPLPGVDVKLTLTDPNQKENVYYLNETGNARYFLELNNLGEGTYEYAAEGTKNGVTIGTDRGQFSIGRSNIETFRLTADKDLLEQVALRTGGSFATAREMDRVADDILQLNSLKPVVSYQTRRLGFTEFPWIFFVLLALLGLEWILRKRFSLS